MTQVCFVVASLSQMQSAPSSGGVSEVTARVAQSSAGSTCRCIVVSLVIECVAMLLLYSLAEPHT